MRVKSDQTHGYTIYAVSGTNTISFAIDFRQADTKGLLGFAVERIDHKYGERKYLDGFKVFKALVPAPKPEIVVNTYTHPVQSFVWDDFTCYDDICYEYFFYPLKGTPQNIDRSLSPVIVKIRTELLYSNAEHDVFFNRGVASSQAYHRKFFNLPPDKITDPSMKQQALNWLSRDLDDAIIKFIGQARKDDTLLGCFYEFHYEPVLAAFKKALDRGVNVKLIIDAKENSSTDKDGHFHESFPKNANIAALTTAGFDLSPEAGVIIQRAANADCIQHNKFIVWQDRKKNNKATQVWTGSTNISEGGICGQTNVGHWIRNSGIAGKFQDYWDILSKDPGKAPGDEKQVGMSKNKAFKKTVQAIQNDIGFINADSIPNGVTPIFSPRSSLKMLDTYVKMFDGADTMACITLAFGINSKFKAELTDNTEISHISLMLLEKEDKAAKKSKQPFVFIGAKQNVYKAWGAYLDDPLYGWARETSNQRLGLNTHVVYIHSKFLLSDPLGIDPKIVTGSANFSDNSTTGNDENMVIIRGDLRAADIYFTEFNRLFNHFYFRAVYNNVKKKKQTSTASIYLEPDDSWLAKYQPGTFRYKKIAAYAEMKGFAIGVPC